jgi:hypothetical protein
MSTDPRAKNVAGTPNDALSENMQDSPMMAHLVENLNAGKDIGEYGRLTFVMIARHFMPEDELEKLLEKQSGFDNTSARALLRQVQARDYSPPKRERILEWQAQQEFPICPTPEDPNSCNVYRELRFPQEIYDRIGEFYLEQAEREDSQ